MSFNRTSHGASMAVAILVAAAAAWHSPATWADPFDDLASDMQVLNGTLPRPVTPNLGTFSFGWPDGRLCVIRGQGDRLLASHSANRGQTFDPDIDILGPSGRTVVQAQLTFNTASEWVNVDADDSGRLYLATLSPNPAGGLDLLATTSNDAGVHWSTPIVVASAATFRPDRIRVAAGPGGRAVVTFRNRNPRQLFAATTNDGGASWNAPVRVDSAGGDQRFVSGAVDAAGNVYVAFTESSGGVHDLYTTVSTDGGFTYATPGSHAVGQSAIDAEIVVAHDGSVVVETVTQNGVLFVFRSIDSGANYVNVYSLTGVRSANPNIPQAGLAASRDSGSIVLIFRRNPSSTSRAAAINSQDNGATFGPVQILSSGPASIGSYPRQRISRTSTGRWIVGWQEFSVGVPYASESLTDGATWQPEVPVAAAGGSPSLAGTGANDVFGAFILDGDLRGSRWPAGDVAFAADAVIGARTGTVPHETDASYTAVAGDQAGHVYTAFSQSLGGGNLGVVVRGSADDGRTFGSAIALPTGPKAQSWYPSLAASSDGYVYAIFKDGFLYGDPVYVNRSSDFGATWQPASTLLDGDNFYTVSMAAQPGGRVWATWSDADPYDYISAVRVARSDDGGESFTQQQLTSPSPDLFGSPVLCATGSRVVVAWTEYDQFTFQPMFRTRISDDSGANFAPAVDLSANAADTNNPPGIACAPSGHAVVAWSDYNGGSEPVVLVSAYDGSSWSTPAVASAPLAGGVTYPKVAYGDSGDTNVVVVYSGGPQTNGADFTPRSTEVHAARSTNGGLSFPTHLRLDASVSSPDAASDVPQVVADGTGRVWVSWIDASSGVAGDMVAALSINGGATFGPPLRLSRQTPQGARPNTLVSDTPVTSYAHAGRAVFAWNGDVDTSPCALFNAWNVDDLDGDGFTLEGDCDDSDPSIYPGAPQQCNGRNDDCTESGWPTVPGDETDPDLDLLPGCADNCPAIANADQADWNHDTVGDACEALTVTGVLPQDDVTDVALQANVVVTFVHPILASTVTSATLRLENDGTLIPVNVSVDPDGIRATIDPIDELAPDLRYDVIATAGITDLNENALNAFASSFVTASGPEPSVPLPSISELLDGPAPDAAQGSSIASAGDLDGNGVADVLIGSPGFPASAEAPAVGSVAVYFGRPGQDLPLQPDIRFIGELANDRAGTSVAGDFDFNADGVPDILIGAEQVDAAAPASSLLGGAPVGPGKVYLIYFDPSDALHYPHLGDGTGATDAVPLELVGIPGGIPGVVFTGEALGDRSGRSVAAGGHLNAGLGDDIAIGAPGRPLRGQIDVGAVYAVFDDPSLTGNVGLARVADGSITQVYGTKFEGDVGNGALGFSVAFPGDVSSPDGDDLVMGAPFARTVLEEGAMPEAGKVYLASEDVFPTAIIDTGTIGVTRGGAQFLGAQEGEHVGWAVAGGGDNIVDGFPDLLMGAPEYDAPPREEHPTTTLSRAGRMYQVSDPDPGGVIEVCAIGGAEPSLTPVGGRIWEGEQEDALLGFAVAGVGDVSGAPYDEIAMGAPLFDIPDPDDPDNPEAMLVDAGRTYVAEGAPKSPTTTDDPGGVIEVCLIGETIAGQRYDGQQGGEQSGFSIAGLGDINGSGDNSFGVGAPDKDTETDEDAGTAYIVSPETRTASGPVARAGADQTLECVNLGAVAHLDGSASFDSEGPLASYLWSEQLAPLAATPVADVSFLLGTHDVVLTVTNASGQSATDDLRVDVVDTHAPEGRITSPAPGTCFGPGVLPVVVSDSFTDGCVPYPSLYTTLEPGPTLSSHGDQHVTVTASDNSGHSVTDAVSFTIDTVPPSVTLNLSGATVVVPGVVPLQPILGASDNDGAAGGITHERLSINGCLIYDGLTLGDRDGLLSDETVLIDRAELCRIIGYCGFGVLTAPVMTFEAADCGANVGSASMTLFSGTIRASDACDPRRRPVATAPRRLVPRRTN